MSLRDSVLTTIKLLENELAQAEELEEVSKKADAKVVEFKSKEVEINKKIEELEGLEQREESLRLSQVEISKERVLINREKEADRDRKRILDEREKRLQTKLDKVNRFLKA